MFELWKLFQKPLIFGDVAEQVYCEDFLRMSGNGDFEVFQTSRDGIDDQFDASLFIDNGEGVCRYHILESGVFGDAEEAFHVVNVVEVM